MKNTNYTQSLRPITFAIIMAYTQISLAQEVIPANETTDSGQSNLSTIVISSDWLGSGLNGSIKKFAGARTIMRRKDIESSGASTLAESLRYMPGVQLSNNTSSTGSNIGLNIGVRGLEGRLSARSTVLQDSLPLSLAPYGQPQLSLAAATLANIDSIDVVRGGGAVRYGPQNVGGIVNFKTRAIPSENFAGEASIRHNRYQDGKHNTQYSAMLGGTNNQGFGAAFLYSGSDGSNWRNHSKEQIHDAIFKFNYDINSHSSFYGKLSHFEAQSQTPGGLTTAQYAKDPFQSQHNYDSWSGRRTALDFGYKNRLSSNKEFEVRIFGTRSFRTSDLANNFDSTATSIVKRPRHYSTFGFEPRYTQRFVTGSTTHDMSTGYRLILENTDEKAITQAIKTGKEVTTRSTKGSTDAHAFYVDDKITVGKWQITPGVRFEHIKISGNNLLTNVSQSMSSNKLLPALNISYSINDGLTAFANYGTSFGSIQHLQMSLQSTSLDRLKPETARTFELGTRYRKNGFKAELTGFNIDFNNQIEYVNTPPIYYKNLGKTLHRGIEAGLSYAVETGNFKGLSAYATYAYTKATLKSGDYIGNDLPFYSRHTNTFGVRYERGPWSADLSTTYQSKQFADEANTVAESENGSLGIIPDYRLWNIQFGWKNAAKSKLAVTLGINNLFDKRYYTRTTDTNRGKLVGAPRTLYLQLKAAF